MAVISGSALGNFKNKFGNAVTAKWLNKNVARIYQPDVANPNTNPQKLVRARFSASVKFAASVGSFLRTVTRSLARSLGMTVYGWFVKANWAYVSASSPADVTIDYSSVKLADGSLEGISVSTVDWGTTTHLTIKVQWATQSASADCDPNDEIYMVAYNPELGKSVMSAAMLRSDGAGEIEVPASFNGMAVHVWAGVIGKGTTTQGRTSDSVYVGHDEVQ